MAAQHVTMKQRLAETHPYNIFFSNINDSVDTPNQLNSINFTDLLCPSMGVLKKCLHITNMIEVKWLMAQYKSMNLENTPMTLLFDSFTPPSTKEYCNDVEYPRDPAIDQYPNLTYEQIEMKEFNWKMMKGKHHSRISIFQYEDDSIRIIVFGGNLWSADWGDYQTLLWISPPLLRLRGNGTGDSPTKFKTTLTDYLSMYKLHILNDWLQIIKNTDFSCVRVFLIVSYPGDHRASKQLTHQQGMKNILSRHCEMPSLSERRHNPWELQICISGIGYYNHNVEQWINPIVKILKCNRSADSLQDVPFKIVYPTKKNVADGNKHGFKYEKEMHEKQLWLNKYLYQWKADALERSAAMASGKTYCMINTRDKQMAWFLLTSANFSKNGWGYPERFTGIVKCRSYEVGVLFIPKFFQKEYFETIHLKDLKEDGFPLMYDLPLKPYDEDDYPYCR